MRRILGHRRPSKEKLDVEHGNDIDVNELRGGFPRGVDIDQLSDKNLRPRCRGSVLRETVGLEPEQHGALAQFFVETPRRPAYRA